LLISITNSKSETAGITSNLLNFEDVMKPFGFDGI